MAEGRLQCLGSSLFLKKEFGVGYQITIEKKSNSADVDEIVTDIVTKAVPEASILSNVSSELSFQLPLDSSSCFVEMFVNLDRIIENDQINMYGVSITTLEEVFLMVARGQTGREHTQLASSQKVSGLNILDVENSASSYRSEEDVADTKVFARHVQSLLGKRALRSGAYIACAHV